jgi:hypothetical protein
VGYLEHVVVLPRLLISSGDIAQQVVATCAMKEKGKVT